MAEKKGKAKPKVKDVTKKKELSEEELKGVSGGLYRAITFATKDDCGGNCMGSVGTATGKQIDT